ncbi:protein-L-isoaspartate O-methyltransferase [Candidatus Endoriftia persephone str. Guaymas]|nr:protein-L-isoaspartate O-methyltransferase [Candidatus Endoriftia persephone str. Guaymas]
MSTQRERQRMIDDIESEIDFTRNMIGRDHFEPRVMAAMRKVPREEFVPPELKHAAFDNGPLPIGHGQTISQPYIVALMTDLLQPEPDHTILEIGTGSGYQTAILSQLCRRVCTMEVIPELSETAKRRFGEMGYDNIDVQTGNGYLGWPEHAPYNGVIVTAAAGHIPPALVEQLRPGGRLVIPVGQPYSYQELMLVEKDREGNSHTRNILSVAFVPLVETIPTAGNDPR